MKSLLFLLAVLLSAFLLALWGGPLLAHHKGDYIAQDKAFHYPLASPTAPKLYAGHKWVLGSEGDAVTYYAGDSELLRLMRTAVDRWETAIPSLNWAEGTATSTADVTVVSKRCRYNLRANVDFTDASWRTDSARRAQYWTNAQICLSNVELWLHYDEHKIGALVHELGHLYGLHEQYIDERTLGACNSASYSVMDGSSSGGPCDGSSPLTADINRVNHFYQRGSLTDFTQVNNGDGTGKVTWLDSAWAEKSHLVWTAYRLSSQHKWKPYGTYDYHSWVGGHKDSGLNKHFRLKATLDLTRHQDDNPGVRLPDVSQYVLCGRPITAQYGNGDVTCSDYIEVSNAAHNAAIPTPTPTPIPDPQLTIKVTNRNPVRGETVTLTATLDPHPPGSVTYQWQRHSNDQWSDISGADSAKLRVRSDSRVTRSYQVEVSYNLNGPVVATSSTVTIRWQDAPTSTPTPTATNTPTPTATNTPEPPTATPTPAQSWCELYPDLCCDDEPWHPFCGPYK